MYFIGNIYLACFIVDAVLSLTDEVLKLGGLPLIGQWRMAVAMVVAALSVPVYLLLGLSPRLPKRVFLPPTLFLFWAWAGSFPLGLYLPTESVMLITAAMQVGISVICLGMLRDLSGGERWWLRPDFPERPFFSARNSAGFVIANLLAAPIFIAISAMGIATQLLEFWTEGYARIRTDGLYCVEQTFTREDKSVHLMATIHVGDDEYYEALARRMANEDGLVLAEGVTDKRGILREPLTYENVASSFGLTPQQEMPVLRVDNILMADIDLSQLSPLAVEFIDTLGRASANRSLEDGLAVYQKFVDKHGPDAFYEVFDELINKRNAHLMKKVRRSLKRHDTLLVPWGAAHMPGISAALLQQGFSAGPRLERRAISFWQRSAGLPEFAVGG